MIRLSPHFSMLLLGLSSCWMHSELSAEDLATPALTPVSFQADWFSNAQFAGFFWAEQGGLYAEHGLDFKFLPFEYGTHFIEDVASGKATFGTAEAYILIDAVAKGADLVALGAVLVKSPAGYIYLKESGIEGAADLKGKRVGIHAYTDELFKFFVATAGLPEGSVEPVKVQHKIETLLDGSVDLHQGYAIDEMLRLQSMTDQPVGTLLFEDLGMPMYSMVIYSSRKYVEAHPEVAKAFVAASAAGWERAMRAPEIAALIVNGPYASEEVDAAMVPVQAKALKPFVMKEGHHTLSMTKAKWAAMQKNYLETGMIKQAIDLDKFLEFSYSDLK
ncbi:ABC transporter substrate-binding protein [Coraliomargarita sp. SDUM461004]|uniref:ABC transporter substrate-binding protein n=1 Tax=Thalassobacterium sedimentorum TaxID=3041258 RepID=A0ABU1AF46_9BACT|nr:ABC transporter substrate-binding protein [Coraliomargarita sp. SDUM461004]MDQ8193421.1 ABC transporter substrate-binding protein [Coraliomargarita sp. SDUM461004]